MDKLYLATLKVAYNEDELFYVPSKKKWYILKEKLFLAPLHRKVVAGQLAYKEKGGVKAYYHSKMEKNVSKVKIELPIGLPTPF
jgi:hypothetical protein